jgi:mono/diheme cytochrome c family protein
MRDRHRLGRLVVVATVVGFGVGARAENPQETKRDHLLDELGLKRKPPAPPSGTTATPAGEPATEEPTPEGPAGKTKSGGRTAAPAGPSFTRAIHPLFLATCKACHTAGGAAGATPLILTGDAEADHRVLVRFADVHAPEASKLLQKASGAVLHGGGAPWPAAGAPYGRVLAWIRAGARLDRAPHEEAAAEPESPEPERHREAERHQTRLPETAPSPPAPQPAPTATPAVPQSAAPAAPGGPTFVTAVHPVLMSVCAVCHRAGGPAGMTPFLLSGDPARDEAVVRALVDPRAPESSLLLTKASGQMHAGGAPLPAGDPRRAVIVAWIAGLAAPPPAVAVAPGTPAAPAATPSVPAAAAPPPPPQGPAPPAGLGLPFGFMLNGRFDLNYERRQFNDNPFDATSVAALRSYHHFLFLSRDAGDPCGLTVEMLTLLFWEGHCRLPWHPGPVSLSVAAGKIVVPFGVDPLFHQSYGGLAGFDQVVLPPVWSIEGVAAHAVYWHGPLAVTDDLYVVRGYALQQADAVINLQSDFSPDDDTKLAIGNRIGVAWMGLSAWYSAYLNPLGFGRRLFMQAIDVNIWRQRQIPVLGHFSLGFGLLRADVSGGGPGVGGVGYDYYDFADYLQVRYYPVDWLFLQYRTGLFTFDNMRGLVVDNSRLTNADGSTHNFGIVARTRNLWFGIFYFINLEKVNEIPNDILRFNVTYEF